MAVRLRGKRWMADLTVAGVRLPRYTFDTEAEAKAWEADAKAAHLNGRPIPGPAEGVGGREPAQRVRTLGDAWARCHDLHWRGTASDQHMHLMGLRVVEYFGKSATVASITTERVEDWVLHLDKVKGLGPATINRNLAGLSKVLRGCKRELVEMPDFRRKKEAEGRLRWATDAEEATLLGLLRQWGKDDQAEVVEVLLDSGFRPSELYRLQARDVDLRQGLMHMPKTKTVNPRAVPMTKRVRAIIERRIKATPAGPLFPYDNFWLGRQWDRARGIMGLADDAEFIPYICRHTFACRLVQRGVSLRTIATLMGHKTLVMTMRYAKSSAGNLADAVALLEPPEPAHASGPDRAVLLDERGRGGVDLGAVPVDGGLREGAGAAGS